MRTVYVNGNYLPENEATISIFDRGFIFADAVYEVTAVIDGRLVDFPGHLARLRTSLAEIKLTLTMGDDALLAAHRQLIELNGLVEGLIYLQVTRGAADRDFLFPPAGTDATVIMFTQKKTLVDNPVAERGQHVILVSDDRWRRRDIKTVQLLYPVLAKNLAREKGADDAWMVEEGYVTEGCSNNAYIVTQDGTLVTRQLSSDILAGITRHSVLKCASDLQIKVEERAFSVEEIRNAREAFSTSASGFVNPVVKVDDTQIGNGLPGPVARRLREVYIEASKAMAL
ncbi:D-amino-acid transaminase [Rhizobium sp. PAMB 3174]